MAWHLSRDGQRFGPFTARDLERYAETGRLVPSDLLWTEGMQDWLPASQFPEFIKPNSSQLPPPAFIISTKPASSKPSVQHNRKRVSDHEIPISAKIMLVAFAMALSAILPYIMTSSEERAEERKLEVMEQENVGKALEIVDDSLQTLKKLDEEQRISN